MTGIALLGALGIGGALGYGAQRGAFCMNSGFRAALEGDWTKVKALALAVAVQLLVLPVVFGLGWAQGTHPPFFPLAAVLGGLLFGLSMRWAGGCAAGVFYKLGAGELGALLALLGMALGAVAAESGPLSALRVALQQALPSVPSAVPPPGFLAAAGLVLLLFLSRLAPGRAGAWSWRLTGLWVGGAAVLAWPLSALAGRDFGLAIVPGALGLLAGASGQPLAVWDALLVLGILIGGWAGARRRGPVRLTSPDPANLLKRFAGGLGLGVGASIAAGCTVGQGLTGLGVLAPGGFGVMGAIFAGSALAALAARRRSLPVASGVRA
jgi:hypothetical protein